MFFEVEYNGLFIMLPDSSVLDLKSILTIFPGISWALAFSLFFISVPFTVTYKKPS
jgi:hypothetical protein